MARLLSRIAGAPKRWWGRQRKRAQSRRRLSLTSEGRYFVGITIGVGLAAINTGNNLLYLLLGWLLSIILASGILSEACLRGIRITRRAPKRVFANRPFLMELYAENTKNRLASYALEVEDVCQGQRIDKRCFFLKIPENKGQTTAYRHAIRKRGLYSFEGFHLATKFPFGLFKKSRRTEALSEVLVFPAVRAVKLPVPRSALAGDNRSHKVGRRGEFFGLREYRDGDDRRSIHWRSSARQDKLLVREYEDESQRRMTLMVDNALPVGHGDEEVEALERAISLCASLATAYIEHGYALRLIARGTHIPFGSGELHVQRVLKTLALLPTVEDEVPFASQVAGRSDAVLVVPKGIPMQRRPGDAERVEAP